MKSHAQHVLLALVGVALVCTGSLHAKNIEIDYTMDEGCVVERSIRIDGMPPRNSEVEINRIKQPITWTLMGPPGGTWKIKRKTTAPMRLCGSDELTFSRGGMATCRAGNQNDQQPRYTYSIHWSGGSCSDIDTDPAIIFDEPEKLMPFIPSEVERFVFPILTLVFALTTLFFWNRARRSREETQAPVRARDL